jgi:hypothetical protein
VHTNTTLAQWHGKTTGTDAQFEGSASSRQVREDIDSRIQQRWIKQLRPQRVVSLRYPLVEVSRRHARELATNVRVRTVIFLRPRSHLHLHTLQITRPAERVPIGSSGAALCRRARMGFHERGMAREC